MTSKSRVEADAKGQFAKSEGDSKNDGLASATPRNITHEEDATMKDHKKKPLPNPGFDIRTQTNSRG